MSRFGFAETPLWTQANDVSENPINPYDPPVLPDSPQGKSSPYNALYALAFVAIASIAFTSIAFLVAICEVVPVPLSIPNLEFALIAAAICGGIGFVPVALFAMVLPRRARIVASILGAILWAVVSGFFFYIWAATVASC